MPVAITLAGSDYQTLKDISIKVQERLHREPGATDIMHAIKPDLEAMASDWPAGYLYKMEGEINKINDRYSDMGRAFILAVILILILLSVLYNSIRQAIITLLVVPLALTGTLLGFFLTNIPFSFRIVIFNSVNTDYYSLPLYPDRYKGNRVNTFP